MTTEDSEKVAHEIAESTGNAEDLVSRLYADAVEDYKRDARIMDYVPLFATRRVRETLRTRAATK